MEMRYEKRNVDGRLQVQLEEDRSHSIRQNCVQKSGLCLYCTGKRNKLSQSRLKYNKTQSKKKYKSEDQRNLLSHSIWNLLPTLTNSHVKM